MGMAIRFEERIDHVVQRESKYRMVKPKKGISLPPLAAHFCAVFLNCFFGRIVDSFFQFFCSLARALGCLAHGRHMPKLFSAA